MGAENLDDPLRGIRPLIAATAIEVVRNLDIDSIIKLTRPLTAEQAAEYLQVTRVGLLKAIRNGRGPKATGAGKWLRFHVSELDAWQAAMASNTGGRS